MARSILTSSSTKTRPRRSWPDIAKQLDRPAFDASLDWDRTAGKLVVLQASQAGQKVDAAAGAKAVIEALRAPVAAPARRRARTPAGEAFQ